MTRRSRRAGCSVLHRDATDSSSGCFGSSSARTSAATRTATRSSTSFRAAAPRRSRANRRHSHPARLRSSHAGRTGTSTMPTSSSFSRCSWPSRWRRRYDARGRRSRCRGDAGATAGRQFRLLSTPEVGCASVTQFVGYIPVGRAPDHFHTYDEVAYVLGGRRLAAHGGRIGGAAPGLLHPLPARMCTPSRTRAPA